MESEKSSPRSSLHSCVSAASPYVLPLLIAIGFWLSVECYFVPITRGGDRNAYLLGGRMLAEGHFTGITPTDPYANYGQHWVAARRGQLQLKFPLGLPSIYAMIRLIGGAANWPADAHQISPLMAAVAIFAAFCMMRPIVGSFHALMGEILLAVSPVTFFFANLPNSHATALCVATCGMAFLLAWWRRGGKWLAIAAGLVLGFNFTVRYTEGLLLLPLLLVTYFNLKSHREAKLLPIAWLVPVVTLLVYNGLVLGHFSGYGLTRESTAFSVANFRQNWPTMLSDLYDGGLFFVLSLSLLGGLLMPASNRRLALVLWSWCLPPILLYSSYYWTPDEAGPAGVHYLRFVLTVVPGLLLMATWLLKALNATIATGAVVAVAVVMEVGFSTSASADMQWTNLTAEILEQHVRADVPAGSLIFGQGGDLIMLQVAGDWRLYSSDLFTSRYMQSFARVTGETPQGLQRQRAQELYALLGGKTDAQLAKEQNRLISQAFQEHRMVFAVLPREAIREFCRRFGLHSKLIDSWQVDGRWCNRPSSDVQIISVGN